MKKFLVFVFLLMAMVSTSCGYMKWKHPTKPDSQWAEAHKECEQQIRETVREMPEAYTPLDEASMIKKCMKEKGWHK